MKIKPVPLQKYLHSILDYNPETGIFVWKSKDESLPCYNNTISVWNKNYAGTIAGCKGKKSIIIYIDKIPYPAHRLAYVYVYGDILTPEMQIDHENTNPFDNKIKNLREATHSQNTANAKKWKRKLLPKGVSIQTNGGRYRARLQVGKRVVYIGTFDTPELAHAAYCEAAQKYHGEYARAA